MILAAGRGQRMQALTEHCPKPLLKVWNKPLIVWHIENLVRAGISEIVINHAYLGHMIEEALGDGRQWGAQIQYSRENTALETAGGIAFAKHLLGSEPFVALAADAFCPYFDFAPLKQVLPESALAWLYLVPNPTHHPHGDFALSKNRVSLSPTPLPQVGEGEDKGKLRYTFSGIAVYRPQLFAAIEPGQTMALAPLLRVAIANEQVKGELYTGLWQDIGTPERLAAINADYQAK